MDIVEVGTTVRYSFGGVVKSSKVVNLVTEKTKAAEVLTYANLADGAQLLVIPLGTVLPSGWGDASPKTGDMDPVVAYRVGIKI